MYIITFYSFKGGVGRTMALVNVAAELVRRGRKVLVVDFDLEAPGLETYKHLRPAKPHPGVVEYVTQFRQTYQVPDLREFIYEAKPIGKRGGRLWVMPAGRRDTAYRRALVDLDWKDLYKNRHGFLLFEDTKKGWEDEFKPDYVLIDSRTGDTDVLGICTRQLPDAVVLMFTPNEQNLVGLKSVCRDIRREADEGLKRQIRLHFVAANVPDLHDEHCILRRKLDAFSLELQVPAPPIIIHRHESLEMLEQPVFALKRPHSRLTLECQRLMRSLIIHNPSDRKGALLFVRQAQQRYMRGRRGRTEARLADAFVRPAAKDLGSVFESLSSSLQYKRDSKMLDEITHKFWDDAKVLVQVAGYLQQLERQDLALRRLDRVLDKLRQDCPEILLQRAICRQQTGDRKGAADDLLRYLGSPDSSTKIDLKGALSLLLEVSLDKFLEALALPAVQPVANLVADMNDVAVALIRQRRWQDAIRYLERQAASAPWRSFYLAMAHWGQDHTSCPNPNLCRQALDHFLPGGTVEDSDEMEATYFQCLSLLSWGTGNIADASARLDRAIKRCHETGEHDIDKRSYWTFAETTPREFLYDCEEHKRMIEGAPVRPVFLGPVD